MNLIDASFPLLTVMIALPAIVALLLWLIPSLHSVARELGMATSLVVLLGAVYLLISFDYSQAAAYQFAETYSWIPSIGVSWALGVNGLGLAMVALSAILVPIVFAADWHGEGLNQLVTSDEAKDNFGRTPRNMAGYVGLTLVSLSFMVMIFAARDLVVFYLAFEAMLIPMYFLIGRYGQGKNSRKAALKFLLYSLAGGLVMLIGVVTIFVHSWQSDPMTGYKIAPDLFTLEYLSKVSPGFDLNVQMLIFVTFFIAFAVKAPMVPVHTWLPDVAGNARPGTSTLLVGVMDKIGTYGMIVFCLALLPDAAHKAALPIVILAVISVLWGAMAALGQKDILRLISFTSVSHFGIMVMGIFIGNKTALMGAMIYMVAHGLSIAAMFLIAGFVVWRGGSQKIADYGGMQRVTPVLAGTFLTAGLATIALPGLSGFVPELLVLIGTFKVAPWSAVLAVLSVVVAAVYILLPYQTMFTGPVPEKRAGLPDATKREKWAVIAPLIALMLVVGLYPKPLVDMTDQVSNTVSLKPMTQVTETKAAAFEVDLPGEGSVR